ncbi:DUF4295 domain-containing protein [Porphyromonas endodontalis]
MAKKSVATFRSGSKDGRAYSKVIKMVKSPKTGAYCFQEEMVLNEVVQEFFK